MKKIFHWLKMIYVAVTFLAATLAFGAATFAWFTANEQVETSRILARTDNQNLELQISRTNFDPQANHEVQLRAPSSVLLPVSTADLTSFVYSPNTSDGVASQFAPAAETLYYHDTIYLRAAATGMPRGTKLALYLDNEIPIVEATSGELLTAARLGFRFNGGAPCILALSPVNEGAGNTSLGGADIGTGKVITLSGGTPTAVNDPAILIDDVMANTARTPIAKLELGTVYQVDIYFYLEGCDPDCTSEKVGLDAAALQVGFYGVPINEEG